MWTLRVNFYLTLPNVSAERINFAVMKTIGNTYRRPLLHFSRWSRKNYGAFVSMGREVSISFLAADIADSSMKKDSIHSVAVPGSSFLLFLSQNSGDTDGPPPESVDPVSVVTVLQSGAVKDSAAGSCFPSLYLLRACMALARHRQNLFCLYSHVFAIIVRKSVMIRAIFRYVSGYFVQSSPVCTAFPVCTERGLHFVFQGI